MRKAMIGRQTPEATRKKVQAVPSRSNPLRSLIPERVRVRVLSHGSVERRIVEVPHLGLPAEKSIDQPLRHAGAVATGELGQ